MRKLWLTNSNNEIFNLNLFVDIEGLGFVYNTDYSEHTLIRSVEKTTIEFATVGGTLLFYDYESYNMFVQYITSEETFMLHYKPSDSIVGYYSKVRIVSLTKTEINKDTSMLHIPISLDLLSYWTKDEVVIKVESAIVSPLVYPYPLTYPSSYSPSEGYSYYTPVVITNDGHTPCPLKIVIYGESINPTWELGIQSGELFLTIQEGQDCVIDSRENVMSITSGTTVLDSYKNHSKQNYIYAPVGTSTLLLGGITEAEVTIYEQFISI